MKCFECIYYESGQSFNRCNLHGFENFTSYKDEECEIVDNEFNQLLDDEGKPEFIERKKLIHLLEKPISETLGIQLKKKDGTYVGNLEVMRQLDIVTQNMNDERIKIICKMISDEVIKIKEEE